MSQLSQSAHVEGIGSRALEHFIKLRSL